MSNAERYCPYKCYECHRRVVVASTKYEQELWIRARAKFLAQNRIFKDDLPHDEEAKICDCHDCYWKRYNNEITEYYYDRIYRWKGKGYNWKSRCLDCRYW